MFYAFWSLFGDLKRQHLKRCFKVLVLETICFLIVNYKTGDVVRMRITCSHSVCLQSAMLLLVVFAHLIVLTMLSVRERLKRKGYPFLAHCCHVNGQSLINLNLYFICPS